MSNRTLSIVIPAYNEDRYIGTLLMQILDLELAGLGIDKEIIVVDDGSTDNTVGVVASLNDVILLRQEKNGGKGLAVRAGVEAARGDFIIIQDADLEYDPRDYVPMIQSLLEHNLDVVYGSRYLCRPSRGWLRDWIAAKNENQSLKAYLGGRSLSWVAWIYTGVWLTDTVTALKLFRKEVIKPMTLETSGFELDHEITSKVLAMGRKIMEVPIRYYPRSRAEGKKIGFSDWLTGVRTFHRYGRRYKKT